MSQKTCTWVLSTHRNKFGFTSETSAANAVQKRRKQALKFDILKKVNRSTSFLTPCPKNTHVCTTYTPVSTTLPGNLLALKRNEKKNYPQKCQNPCFGGRTDPILIWKYLEKDLRLGSYLQNKFIEMLVMMVLPHWFTFVAGFQMLWLVIDRSISFNQYFLCLLSLTTNCAQWTNPNDWSISVSRCAEGNRVEDWCMSFKAKVCGVGKGVGCRLKRCFILNCKFALMKT